MQNEDDDKMAIQVWFLSENEIERDAEFMLAEYEETADEPVKLPVPVAGITTYRRVNGPWSPGLDAVFLRRS
jgi:hypothetical protein